MSDVHGLHHVTAISGSARGNLAFWRDVLGLRFVKKTVNFDDPSVYHLYYGDELGRPGSAMTFFPWEHMARGRRGAGEVAETQLAVPTGALAWWQERLAAAGVDTRREQRFGEPRLTFRDTDGLDLALVEAPTDDRAPWTPPDVSAEVAIRGFRGVTLHVADPRPTVALLTGLMDYRDEAGDGEIRRLLAPAGSAAPIVDVATVADRPARLGAGSVHHVAFSVADSDVQHRVRTRLVDAGLNVTPPIDRDYFMAIYFRSPGGVLFEIATDEPGFTVDEAPDRLGAELKLPRQHEHLRAQLERTLPALD